MELMIQYFPYYILLYILRARNVEIKLIEKQIYNFQVKALKRTFDQFDSDKSGAISVGTVNTILKMMGMHVSSGALEV